MPEVHRIRHSWAQARSAAFDAGTSLPDETISLSPAAVGRKLAAPIFAQQDIPYFASSAMDGWAVSGSGPWIFAEPGQRLHPGQASAILTGGIVPAGARAVLRSESGEEAVDDEGLPVLRLSGDAKPGEPRAAQHIRQHGQEAAEGELLLKPGLILNPAQIAVIALAGLDRITVAGRPTVQLLFTGDEVVDAGIPLPGKVRDVFAPQLAAVFTAGKARVLGQARIQDDLEQTVTSIEASNAELVITTGGTGFSAADHVRRALVRLDAELIVDGIAMRPGGTSLLARLTDGRFLIGLPGNPLAAFMGYFTLATPLLAALSGEKLPSTKEVASGSAQEAFTHGTRLMPYRDLFGLASPVGKSDSAMLRGLAEAAGVLIVPPHGLKLGEKVESFELPWS
ncbi:molybdopterin biosynthesis MoeA protein [Renibacterium salmoninarum ATCC 33209]|uniref:Molybdopterin molybdenumtransferase n=1 Tax=Renibacterium salmoninarum (strain ATCC 33209 / DSM 20767 / JCM 11484 / NBRC 15589 / NCIMB 2235) TaxID=288705 RepID=A9WKY7_RENSM|nr:molybdopterin molybdotransferase MoeA [Renibacterium salmoninarum]ABY22256.1 molybdopterin biosynthesis MoeA protein [Renibacterium salmoninarum ATCC 33209]